MPKVADLPDEIVLAIAEKFLKGEGATRMSEWLRRKENLPFTREQAYRIISEANRRGIFVLSPPAHHGLRQRLADRYDKDIRRIFVISASAEAPASVATAGADIALNLFKELGVHKQTVHVGLGGGWTTMLLAERLALRLRSDIDAPDLALHALSSGFNVHLPRTAPVSFFSFFEGAHTNIRFVGLFANPVVRSKEYSEVKKLPGVCASFECADQIDVVVTSLASANHEHGDLNQFIQVGGSKDHRTLNRAGWIGDVQYRPYAATGPITTPTDIRAVTLFELEDLVRMARMPTKRVLLVAGPCTVCGRTRSDALRPLLKEPSLEVWSHVVVDTLTATELLN